MKRFFYKDKEGIVFEYDDEQARNKYGKPELLRMSDADVQAHLTPPQSTNVEIDRARLIAYADPITGSDRFKLEADAERLSGNEEAAKAVEEKWLARRAEIAQKLPWPKEE